MTTNMVRKQIYIYRRQQNMLRELARQRRTSEAEIIRRAIDRETTCQQISLLGNSLTALEELIQAAFAPRNQPTSAGEPYIFNRDELYEGREKRRIQGQKKG